MINKKRKPTPVKATAKATEETQPEITQIEPVQEAKVTQPIEKKTPAPASTPDMNVEPPVSKVEPPSKLKTPTMASLKAEVDELQKHVFDLTMQIADIKIQLALKRKATANNKIQIHDKHTGIIYKSKNNTYQSMLKKGELKELVDMGIFGKEPIKNTFGIYALLRAWPDRFEEVHDQEKTS